MYNVFISHLHILHLRTKELLSENTRIQVVLINIYFLTCIKCTKQTEY